MSFDRDSDSCRNIVRSDDELLAYRNWIAERYAKAQSLYFSSLWSEAQNELKLLIGVCVYPHDFEEVFYGGCIQQIDPVMFGLSLIHI